MVVKHEGYSSWEPHWTLQERNKSSRTRFITHEVKKGKRLPNGDMQDPQGSLMEASVSSRTPTYGIHEMMV